MLKLVNADALLRMICELCGGECKTEDKDKCAEWDLANSAINKIDTIEIVHCKDCKHLSVRSGALGVYKCDIHDDFPSGEYFCADGERKEDGNS